MRGVGSEEPGIALLTWFPNAIDVFKPGPSSRPVLFQSLRVVLGLAICLEGIMVAGQIAPS